LGTIQVYQKLLIFFKKKSDIDYPTCVFARISSAGLDKEPEVDFIVRPKKEKIINLT
jgi:phosphohistidine phosphatase